MDGTRATYIQNISQNEVQCCYTFACVTVKVTNASRLTRRSQPLMAFLFQGYTGKYSFYNIPWDVMVILKVTQGKRPKKPTTEMERVMSNGLWDLVKMCWK